MRPLYRGPENTVTNKNPIRPVPRLRPPLRGIYDGPIYFRPFRPDLTIRQEPDGSGLQGPHGSEARSAGIEWRPTTPQNRGGHSCR